MKNNQISLDKFIKKSLYNKENGYYSKKKFFGSRGDFITSPLISHLYSEMLAIWCVAFWEKLNKPKKIRIIELGPGDGTMCFEMINVFKRFDAFYDCLKINLLEISKDLIKKQKLKLRNEKIKWISNLNQIKSGPIIFIGNEFFDSLPIKQLKKNNNSFLEKYASFSKNEKKIKFSFKAAGKKLTKDIIKLKLNDYGDFIEYPIISIKYLEKLSKMINTFGGGLLMIDYGYNIKKMGDTLQAVKNHKFSKLNKDIGKNDISAHVNFYLFSEILKSKKLNVSKVVTQSEFLQKMGIIQRANILANKMSFKEKSNLFYRMKRLLDKKEMGEIFKVLFAQKKKSRF